MASSLLLSAAQAATRPHYGGTLRVAMAAAPASLDPLALNQSGSLAGRNLSHLLFDTLVALDDRGRPLPALAISWQADPGNQRWQFQLRQGVAFQDGTAVTAEQVASSLRVANPSWRVLASGDTVVIERDSPSPELAPELALARNGIAKRDGTKLFGTGPFAVTAWEPGKKLRLAASNEYWGGRPFLDSVEIDMGQGFREQMLALDLGRADLIEVAPEQAHHAAAEGRRVESSLPVDLVALVFAREAQSTDDTRLRLALTYSIDRQALNSVLLQSGGEPAGALLPNWMTGYAFLFSTSTDLVKANLVRGPLRQASPWSLSYDAGDALESVLAERIALNARDAGLQLQLTNSAAADLRLVRTPIRSLDRRIALTTLETAIGVGRSNLSADSTQDFYSAERLVLESRRVIPLLHARVSFGLSGTVRNWTEGPGGSWRLADVWLGAGKP